MIYSLAVMLIVASLDSVRSALKDDKWYTVQDERGTHVAIGSNRDNSAADYSVFIKTKTVDNESKVIIMTYLRTFDGDKNGDIQIDFVLNKVRLRPCQKEWVQLPDHTPTDADKVWNIVRTAEPRIVVYVNGVEVLNLLLSDETCPDEYKKWSIGDVVGVVFYPIDRSTIAGYMLGSCDAGQFLDMETGCTDCPEDQWSENDNDIACTPCPEGKTVGSGLGKGESDCAGTSTEENNHNYSHAVALKISSTLLVGLLFALITEI